MIITLIFLILFISLIFIFFIPNTSFNLIRQLGLLVSSICLILSIFLFYDFYFDVSHFQFLTIYKLGFDFLNLYFLPATPIA